MKNRVRSISIVFLMMLFIHPIQGLSAKSSAKSNYEKHDYVIIGGGTAGLTLAYLLKQAKKDVVVIEAGRNVDDDPNILNAKTLNELEVQFRNEYFWVGDAKPLTPAESRSTNVHANHYSGGRVVGGTSSTNDTIWWRMQKSTYDRAGGIFADEAYINLIFKAIETYTGVSQSPDKRGKNGPLLTTQGPTINGILQTNPIAEKFASAVQTVYQSDYSIDIPLVTDYNVVNGPFVSNFGQFTINPYNLQRSSASIAFLNTPTGKKIDVRLDAQLLKIGFCGKRATTVTYVQHNNVHKIHAKKKIILCTGHNTPNILLQNGIGDASLLKSLKINVVHDNSEVGKNLKNHIFMPILIFMNPTDAATANVYPLAFKMISGASALPQPGNPNSEGRDYQIGILGLGGNIGALIVIFVNPQSTGNVTIVDKDPLLPPVVNLNYLTNPADLNSMIQGVQIAKRIIQEMHAIDPSYNLISDLSNPALFVNANTSAFHHWHGQSLIGEVVDENLHVIGVKNLMIADLSIFPLTDGNTQSMAYSAGCAAYTLITGDKNVEFNKPNKAHPLSHSCPTNRRH